MAAEGAARPVEPAPAQPAEAQAKPASPAEEPAPAADAGAQAQAPQLERVARLVSRARLYADGRVERVIRYSYTAEGRLAEERHESASGELVQTVLYTYEGDLLSEKSTRDASGAVLSTQRYAYADGKLATEVLLDSRGRQQTRSAFEYDGNGNLARWSFYDGTDAPLGSTVYLCRDGRVAEAQMRTITGQVDGYLAWSYDAEGRKTRESVLSAKREVQRFVEYRYGQGALVEERHLDAPSRLRRSVLYENDGQGNPLGITYLDSDGRIQEIQRLEYEYVER